MNQLLLLDDITSAPTPNNVPCRLLWKLQRSELNWNPASATPPSAYTIQFPWLQPILAAALANQCQSPTPPNPSSRSWRCSPERSRLPVIPVKDALTSAPMR